MKTRNRILYGGLTVGVLLVGLASRRFFGDYVFVRLYVGDSLWALMVFFGVAFLFPKGSVQTVALMALIFCFGIEFSQLYHAPWIDQLRATTIGGLILGFSFVWSDLLCYSVGIAVGVVINALLDRKN